MSRRLLVVGSRDWTNGVVIRWSLLAFGPATIVHAGQPGAEALAAACAVSLGWPTQAHAANPSHGRAAIARRDEALLTPPPDVLVAFPLLGCRQTWALVRKARRKGVAVVLPTVLWRLHKDADTIGLAVAGGAVVEASAAVRWTVGRPVSDVFPHLWTAGWRGRPVGY